MPGYEGANFTTKTIETSNYSDFDLTIRLEELQKTNNLYGQQYRFFEFEAYLYVHYVAIWTIRNNSGALIDEFTDRDLLVWRSGISAGRAEAVGNLPTTQDAWWDTGIAIAQKYASRIAPQWHTGERHIYMINRFPDLSLMAYTAMQNDAYMRAFDIWENMLISSGKRQKKTKSQIAYNIAVAYEFQNQLEQALYWARRSANMKLTNRNANYIRLLQERQRQQTLLDEQLIRNAR